MNSSSFLFVDKDIIPDNYNLIKEVNIFLDNNNLDKNYYYLDFIPNFT